MRERFLLVGQVSMKVIVRSSSFLFVLVNLLLGLPMRRRPSDGNHFGVLPSSAANEVPAKTVRS